MSTIRPLATIAILAVLGVFLANKINQGPTVADGQADEAEAWGDAPAYGTTSDSAGDGSSLAASSSATSSLPTTEAPSFDGGDTAITATTPPAEYRSGTPSLQPPTAPQASNDFGNDANSGPAMPALPGNDAFADIELPDDIPEANYEGGPSMVAPAQSNASPSNVASQQAAAPAYAPPAYEAPSYDAPAYDASETTSLPTPPAATGLSSAPASEYGAPMAESPFAAAQANIQAALERGELARAHLLLSQWYGDPSLTTNERAEVDRLLGELAGSVIYSTDHLLAPPHQVQSGETLETIAAKNKVSWQLLAKINRIPTADGVQPGQIIKVLQGPFQAVVDLSESELVLNIAGRYAGRFPVQLDGTAASESQWKVADKQVTPGRSLVLQNAANPSSQPIVLGEALPSTFDPNTPGRISVADADLNDLFDILSVGSEVTIRR